MSDMKQVKVDNWGIYFLQRLKHFFNRTDYCDLTLQFQDNAQLKVHRLVLNACTEYFELLERTCEMYEDCLIMPDDLQADVVVPIINFMYTGQLEFKPNLLDRLYQTSQIMNMPVLSKLLLAQKEQSRPTYKPNLLNNQNKRSYSHAFSSDHVSPSTIRDRQPPKKSYPTQKLSIIQQEVVTQKKKPAPVVKTAPRIVKTPVQRSPAVRTPVSKTPVVHKPYVHPSLNYTRHVIAERRKPAPDVDPRPTRYEVPEDLADNIYDDSFKLISYESKPLMVHPETSKRYGAKKTRYGIFNDASISKYGQENATIDVVQCVQKISQNDEIFQDDEPVNDPLMFDSITAPPQKKDSSQLFDQILVSNENNGPKITIENKDSKESANNIDHAKLISEVLKKYPHLVKGNKNIKLKILDTKPKVEKKVSKKNVSASNFNDVKVKTEKNEEDYTYETEVIDSKEAARLISLGAENVKGPWICLICGTPGRALHFATYHQFRRHLVDVHNEKIVPNICEYCGIKSNKRNHLFYHLLTKHGVTPPHNVKFPKCNHCSYVALTEAYLVKHKASHNQDKLLRCNVCSDGFHTSSSLLQHIQETGHKIKFMSDKRTMLRCVYCLKEFIRENNLYAHLLSRHKDMATRDGIIDGSDDERSLKDESMVDEPIESKYEIQQKFIEKANTSNILQKQRILNVGYNNESAKQPLKNTPTSTINNTFEDTDLMGDEIEVILPGNNETEEMLASNAEFEEQSQSTENEEYIVDIQPQHIQLTPSNLKPQIARTVKKSGSTSQELQIVVSSAEDLKTLMSSNHQILFDQDGHTSKTLAVLTTPQCSSMSSGTQINIETDNPNEVMIIPDQYVNVSQAVSGDNSNIVVVYSDELDQNKQYIVDPAFTQGQLVTAEEVTTHFVQSSAVITPNYTTVSNSEMSQEMVTTQAETWQEIEQSTENQDEQMVSEEPVAETDMEQNSIDEHSLIEPEMIDNNLEEMNNISIIQNHTQQTNNKDESDPIIEKGDSAVLIINQETKTDDATQNSTQAMEVDESNEDLCNTESSVVSNDQVEQTVDIAEEGIEEPNPHTIQEIETAIEDADENHSQEIITTVTGACIQDNNDITDNISSEEALPIDNNEENINAVAGKTPGKTVKKIENLTSEWSEDEDDKANDEDKHVSNDSEIVQTVEPSQTIHAEVEESIENIQDEVNKQINSEVVYDPAEVDEKEVNEEPEALEEHEEFQPEDKIAESKDNEVVAEPQENISLLLNDWSENDSQEADDNELENGNDDEVADAPDATAKAAGDEAAGEGAAETGTEAVAVAAAGPPKTKTKPDNIRSLVSDWDEDDEDSKA